MDENKTPNNAVPQMSREFLSADDAARYAHEQIGQRRDRKFVAMIFKRGAQRFVVTEPVEAGDHLLETQLFAVDGRGRPVYPANHQLDSWFYSHQALSTLDAAQIRRLKWSRMDATVSLQMFSIHELFHIVASGVPAYLSGAEDSLLWFEEDSAGWQSLLQRLGTPTNPGALAQGLEQGSILPVEFVREVAQAGTLRIVLDNAPWGYRGKVTGQWSPLPTLGERPVPQQVAYSAIFSSADEAAQDRFSRMRGQTDQEQTWFGFILKQQGKEEYVATELVAVNGVRDKLFSRSSLFSLTHDFSELVAPESFKRHSYFYSRQRVTHTRPNREWLARHFIVPRDLFVAVYDSRRPLVVEGPGVIPTYIGTQDGALLKYVMRTNSKLFDNATPNMGLDDVQSNLASGKLSPSDFVKVVANSGALSVLHTNAVWDREGVVDTNWRPAQNLERCQLSAAFATANDAVLSARSQIPADTDRVYGGLVLKRSDGLFVATQPVIALHEDFAVEWIFPDVSIGAGLFPAGCSMVGRYRSRQSRTVPVILEEKQRQLYLNMLSVKVVYTAFKRGGRYLDEYLFGPDGSVIRYRCGTWRQFHADLANALNGFGNLPHDLDAEWIRKRIHEGDLSPVDWIDSLARNGYLQVVVGSPAWGPPRMVDRLDVAVVEPGTHSYAKASSEPRYSPMFAQESDAARFAHEQAGERAAPGFGFILHNERLGTYHSTLPVAVQDSALAYDRVFPEGQLPSGYIVSSVYLCAARQEKDAGDDEFGSFFFSPMAVHQVLARARISNDYRPVYFSCADGALLQFEKVYYTPGVPPDAASQSASAQSAFGSLEQAHADLRNIRLRTFTLGDYIQRMVKAGRLEVLVSSDCWAKGYVARYWQPRHPGMSEQELWSWKPELPMGPIFHHPDDAASYIQRRAGSAYTQVTTYESAIVAKPDTYSYCGLEPLPQTDDSLAGLGRIFRTLTDPDTSRRNEVPRFAPGYKLMASHQLYLSGVSPLAADEEQVYSSFTSPMLMQLHTHALKAKGFNISAYYYSTPHGALIKYVPENTQAEKQLLLTRQIDFVDGRWVTKLSMADFISKLAETGELRVLQAAHFWNRTGRLGQDWKVVRLQSPLAPVRFQRDEL